MRLVIVIPIECQPFSLIVHRWLQGKRLLKRPRRRWEDNIKMDFQEVGEGSWRLDGVGSG